MIRVRAATPDDAAAWLQMRRALWPDDAAEWHAGEIKLFFAGRLRMPRQDLVALDSAGKFVGFAELSIRAYAEDCVTDRVAYLEGWYVIPEARRQGVGRALIGAAEDWAHSQGCTEFASDALLDNEISARAHRALGAATAHRTRCSLVLGRVLGNKDRDPAGSACRDLPMWTAARLNWSIQIASRSQRCGDVTREIPSASSGPTISSASRCDFQSQTVLSAGELRLSPMRPSSRTRWGAWASFAVLGSLRRLPPLATACLIVYSRAFVEVDLTSMDVCQFGVVTAHAIA